MSCLPSGPDPRSAKVGKEQPHPPELESMCSSHPPAPRAALAHSALWVLLGNAEHLHFALQLMLQGVWSWGWTGGLSGERAVYFFLNANNLPCSLKYSVQGLKT